MDGTCLWGHPNIKTGFNISTGVVLLYEACHDVNMHHTYYTKFLLGKDAEGFQRLQGFRPDWEQGPYFG